VFDQIPSNFTFIVKGRKRWKRYPLPHEERETRLLFHPYVVIRFLNHLNIQCLTIISNSSMSDALFIQNETKRLEWIAELQKWDF
jgi:hypothetical protein